MSCSTSTTYNLYRLAHLLIHENTLFFFAGVNEIDVKVCGDGVLSLIEHLTYSYVFTATRS